MYLLKVKLVFTALIVLVCVSFTPGDYANLASAAIPGLRAAFRVTYSLPLP